MDYTEPAPVGYEGSHTNGDRAEEGVTVALPNMR
jgi:hypothetical protein